DAALTYAVALADKFQAELHLLHVVQDLSIFVPDAVAVMPPLVMPSEQFTAAARQALERVVRERQLELYRVRADVREGAPFYEIVRFAKENETDLIVMGTHGRSGLAH